jgi:UrcA family protein
MSTLIFMAATVRGNRLSTSIPSRPSKRANDQSASHINTKTHLLRALSGSYASAKTAIILALLIIVPLAAIADQHTSPSPDPRLADVPLADLNLSTPEGMRTAGERLRGMAERVCATPAGSRGLDFQPNYVACVDGTLANALRQIRGPTINSITRAANVSVADLDLSTLEGMSAARERLRTVARRLCTELARKPELSYQPNFEACVGDTLTAALRQVNALAAAKESRIARRTAP